MAKKFSTNEQKRFSKAHEEFVVEFGQEGEAHGIAP